MAEYRKRFFQMVGQQGHSQQIRGGSLVVGAGSFSVEFIPIFDTPSPRPSQLSATRSICSSSFKIMDEADKFGTNRIIFSVLQDRTHAVIGRIGARIPGR